MTTAAQTQKHWRRYHYEHRRRRNPLDTLSLTNGNLTPIGKVRPNTHNRSLPLLDAAIAAWAATGISVSQLAQLAGLQIGIADLSGVRLGEQFGNTITLDVNAAGYGWFVSRESSDKSQSIRTPIQALDSRLWTLRSTWTC